MSTAVHSGILAFSDDLSAADHVNAILMGFDPGRIPMVRESARLERYPLTTGDPHAGEVTLNGEQISVAELRQLERTPFEPHPNWREVLGPAAAPGGAAPPAPAVIVPADRPAALGIARSLGSRGVPVYGVDHGPPRPRHGLALRHPRPSAQGRPVRRDAAPGAPRPGTAPRPPRRPLPRQRRRRPALLEPPRRAAGVLRVRHAGPRDASRACSPRTGCTRSPKSAASPRRACSRWRAARRRRRSPASSPTP